MVRLKLTPRVRQAVSNGRQTARVPWRESPRTKPDWRGSDWGKLLGTGTSWPESWLDSESKRCLLLELAGVVDITTKNAWNGTFHLFRAYVNGMRKLILRLCGITCIFKVYIQWEGKWSIEDGECWVVVSDCGNRITYSVKRQCYPKKKTLRNLTCFIN